MGGHDWWHLTVLGSTLMAAAGLGILVLTPLVFGETPPGLAKARPWVLASAAAAGMLLGAEWLGVH
ncbi:MAG TPA: hypothetical protein VFS18_01000 [Actinomycetota bacterium]|nr:hypothetical protein [Actinomycetota bacterium]